MSEEKKQNNKVIIYFGIGLVLIGFAFIFGNYFLEKRQAVYEEISLALSEIPEVIEEDEPIEEPLPQEPVVVEEENFTYNTESINDFNLSKSYYVGKLIISKINLAKGFAAQNTNQNTVEKNIAIMSPCDYPNVENGNFIIAAHSGNSWKSFFRDLGNLTIGDEALIYYKNTKYSYKLVNIYNEPKGLKLKIYRNINKTTLTLITCSMSDKESQTIYIFER